MKKILAFALAIVVTSCVYAQSGKEDVDIIQDLYGKSKKEVLVEYMKFSEAENTAFWPVYDAFENERKVLGRERYKIISDYAANYSKLDNAKAADLAAKAIDNNVALEKLNQTYFPKFNTAIGALRAAKYMQLELYMQTVVRTELQDQIPFIDELDKSKKKK
ncbi:MAG: hypothetical protein ACHQNT_05570 [Bacteroidia bacterium]